MLQTKQFRSALRFFFRRRIYKLKLGRNVVSYTRENDHEVDAVRNAKRWFPFRLVTLEIAGSSAKFSAKNV